MDRGHFMPMARRFRRHMPNTCRPQIAFLYANYLFERTAHGDNEMRKVYKSFHMRSGEVNGRCESIIYFIIHFVVLYCNLFSGGRVVGRWHAKCDEII